jgi:hypothetical protein
MRISGLNRPPAMSARSDWIASTRAITDSGGMTYPNRRSGSIFDTSPHIRGHDSHSSAHRLHYYQGTYFLTRWQDENVIARTAFQNAEFSQAPPRGCKSHFIAVVHDGESWSGTLHDEKRHLCQARVWPIAAPRAFRSRSTISVPQLNTSTSGWPEMICPGLTWFTQPCDTC